MTVLRPWLVVVAVAASLLAGFAAGYLYRRSTDPSLQERARDAAKELESAVKKMTK